MTRYTKFYFALNLTLNKLNQRRQTFESENIAKKDSLMTTIDFWKGR